jgi:hypothetical protein
MPLSMRKHTGTHTCDGARSRVTGIGGDSRQQNHQTALQLRHCQWQNSPTTQQARAQAHALPCNNPHQAECIQASQSLGVRAGDKAGIRSHKSSLREQPLKKKGGRKREWRLQTKTKTTTKNACPYPLSLCPSPAPPPEATHNKADL